MIKATHQPSLYALFTSHQFLFTRTNLPKAIFVGSCAPSQIVLDNFSIKGNPSLSDHARLEIVQPGVKLCSLAYSGGPREMSEWLGTLELKRNRSKSSYYGVILPASGGKRGCTSLRSRNGTPSAPTTPHEKLQKPRRRRGRDSTMASRFTRRSSSAFGAQEVRASPSDHQCAHS